MAYLWRGGITGNSRFLAVSLHFCEELFRHIKDYGEWWTHWHWIKFGPQTLAVSLKSMCLAGEKPLKGLPQQEVLFKCGKPGTCFHSRTSKKSSPFCSRWDGNELAFLELIGCCGFF